MAKTYDEKRNFTLTPEPQFDTKRGGAQDRPLRFVIQRHEASHLHFDFRLECEGALKSWAVPKGPSLDPKVKRTAIMVEDHPLDYADFEGRIPKGQYGGGEVLIWDEGTYAPEDATGDRAHDEAMVLKGLGEGKLSFVLHGTRLQGGFVLVRTPRDDQWLLMKRTDPYASPDDPTREVTSVRTGRTSDDLRAGRKVQGPQATLLDVPGAVPRAVPATPSVMVPTEVGRPFTSDLWTFEVKLDGIRALVVKNGSAVKVLSRNGNDITRRFASIARAVEQMPQRGLVLDGEIVLLDENGRPSFQALMDAYHQGREGRDPVFFAFDLLHVDDLDLRKLALVDRRAQLERLSFAPPLRLLDTLHREGELLYEHALEHGFEGIVAKKLSSPYREATRTEDWLKVKGYHTEEFLVAGYTRGTGSREDTFGALLLGRRDPKGDLHYVGSVGGGFSGVQLREMRDRLDPMRLDKSPFAEAITTRGEPTFTRPELIAEVRFMNWTRDGKLRFPIFKRLRPDLDTAPPLVAGMGTSGASEVDAILEALETPTEELQLTVDGNPVRLTSLGRELWPGISKRELLRYFARVSDTLLGYLRDRPLTFVRYPDGLEGEGFFQRHWSQALPEFVDTVSIWSESGGEARRHLMCNNLATLLWLGQMSTLELHPWHARVKTQPDAEGLGAHFENSDKLDDSVLQYPDYLVCDLDPNIRSGKEAKGAEPELNEKGWLRTVEVALAIREVLDSLGLRGYLKTTGKTGLHIYVPLQRIYENDQVREAARTIGQHLVKIMPKDVTMETLLAKRPAKVYFDANMNGLGRTLASAYSTRPVAGARVSMPIAWERLTKVRPEDFTIFSVPTLLAEQGDPWTEMPRDKQKLLS